VSHISRPFFLSFFLVLNPLSKQYVMNLMADSEVGSTDTEPTIDETEEEKKDDTPDADAGNNNNNNDSIIGDIPNLPEIPEDFTYDECPIGLLMRESIPGMNFGDVDPTQATFVVASNPLTKTHTWNPMPRNSIMWCTRGQMPQLRLLRSKKPKHRSIVSDHTIVL